MLAEFRILQILIINLLTDGVQFTKSFDDFFIVNKYVGSQYFCITNSSYALSWITKNTKNDLQVSKFIPTRHNFWHAACEDFSQHHWQCSYRNSPEIVLDRRWEEMEVYKTDYRDYNSTQPQLFTTVSETLSDDFQIALSIRTEQEAHIFLCEGDDVTSSNCYWLMLQGFSGRKSGIRKCPANTNKGKLLKEPCKTLKTEIIHTSTATKFLSKDKWNHFILSKVQNRLVFKNFNGEEILSHQDSEKDVYRTKYVMIHSKLNTGLWKIHNIEYFETTQSKITYFHRPVNLIDGQICMTMFVKMCEKCKMRIEIRNLNSENEVLEQETYTSKQQTQWFEVTFARSNINATQVLFALTTINDNEDPNQYWSISDIKQCHKDGFRMIQSDEMATCQLMAPETEVLSLNNKITVTSSISDFDHCEEETVSKHCIPCDWFSDGICGKLKFCEQFSNGLKCSCSAGYQKDIYNNCVNPCPGYTYGHECKKRCSRYCSVCNKVNGTCTSCLNEYKGPKCDKPPNPVFKNSSKKLSHAQATSMEDLNLWKIFNNAGSYDTYRIRHKRAQFLDRDSFTSSSGDYEDDEDLNLPETFDNISNGLPATPEKLSLATQPVLDIKNQTIGMTLFLNDVRGKTDHYRILILRPGNETDPNFNLQLQKFGLRGFIVLIDCSYTTMQHSISLIIGQSQQMTGCQDHNNSPLEPATSYIITIVLINTYRNEASSKMYLLTAKTTGELVVPKGNSAYFALFGLLLLIPLGLIAIYYIRTKLIQNRRQQGVGNSDTRANDVEQRRDQMPLMELQSTTKKTNLAKDASDIHLISKNLTKLTPVKQFEKYLKKALDNQELQNQYENILETALVYERIVVDSLMSESVDMNFNSGLQIKNAYIITELPTTIQFKEFWKTVADENIRNVVLFAHVPPSQERSTSYWPELGKSLRCGNIIIECKMCQKYTFYTRREFSLKCKTKIQKVDQLHFSLPPSDSRYLSSLNYVQFFNELLKVPLSSKSPILVHSSSGMRGVGLALICDMSLRCAQKDGAIDVIKIFKTLIQTITEMDVGLDHYVAAHAIIADTLNHLDTSVAFNSFDCSNPELFTREEIKKHSQHLKDTLWLDEMVIEEEKEFYVNSPTIRMKNQKKRNHWELPSGDHSQLESPDFVKVDGFKSPGKFWVAKRQPSTSFSDFLKSLEKNKISVIVALNPRDFIWPSEDHPEIFLDKNITIKYKCVKRLRWQDWFTFELRTHAKRQTIEVITFKKSSAPVVSLPNIEDFLNFVIESNEIFQNTKPVVITCHDGVTYSGLYLAMSYNIQQIKIDGICDVCTSIRILRRYCKDFVKDNEQYIFLLKAAHNYMKEFSLYETR